MKLTPSDHPQLQYSQPSPLGQLPAAVGTLTGGASDATAARPVEASVAQVCQATLITLSAHCVPILTCAAIGFAITSVVSVLTTPTLQNWRPNRTPVDEQDALRLAWLTAMAVVEALMRGMITWIALQSGGQGSPRLRHAWIATLKRLDVLLFGVLIYGVVIAVATTPISDALREVRVDQTQLVPAGIGVADYVHEVAKRDGYALLPDPGGLFVEFFLLQRTAEEQALVRAYGCPVFNFAQIAEANVRVTEHDQYKFLLCAEALNARRLGWLKIMCALLCIVAAETMFRLRIVMAFETGSHPRNRISSRNPISEPVWKRLAWPFVASARLGLRHFGLLTLHIWSVRLALFGIRAVFVTLPIVLAQSPSITNALKPVANVGLFNENQWLLGISFGLVYALLTAFSFVYDARLYAAIVNRCRCAR